MNLLSIDPSDTTYQSFRSGTTRGLEIGSLIAGGYGAVKGVMAFNKLAKMPVQAAKVARNLAKEVSAINQTTKTNQIWTSTKKRTSVQNAYIPVPVERQPQAKRFKTKNFK